MTIHYQDDTITLHHGDCIDVLASLPESSVDAVVTDPPYGLEFMGRAWDRYTPGDFQHWCEQWAAECLRVLKPGGHMVAFGGTRTFHRLTAGVEDAGFEIRDVLTWLYGSGFPKSLDVSKAIAGTLAGFGGNSVGIRRATMGDAYTPSGRYGNRDGVGRRDTGLRDHELAMPTEAQAWEGWGTALKPAWEPVILARKPLAGTVASNVLAHGTGALNIDECRIGDEVRVNLPAANGSVVDLGSGRSMRGDAEPTVVAGRWPANVVLDDDAAAALDEQTAALDGASRFFYSAKADAAERPIVDGVAHPTVKPLALMEWLIRLVTPPGGVVLEPFAGSGTTLEAAQYTGHPAVGIEKGDEYLPLIVHRLERLERRDPRVKPAKRVEVHPDQLDLLHALDDIA